MNKRDEKTLNTVLAQLRHTYTNMLMAADRDCSVKPETLRSLAKGLLGPQIVKLERLQRALSVQG